MVTGGTQGVGWAIARALAENGAQVYACGLSTENLHRALSLRATLPQSTNIHLSQCDVSDRAALTEWLERVYAETGRLDVLVNNAAYVRWSGVCEMSVEEAERTMRVAYDGMLYGVKAALPHMMAANQGHIINVGSITGSIFVGGASAAYSAAKAAVEAYTRTLHVELHETPVHVTLLRLGTVAGTDFFAKHVAHTRMPRLLDFLPYLQPEDIGHAVVRVITRPKEVVTLPRYLSALRIVFTLMPRFSRWLTWRGGAGRRRYQR